MAIKVSPLVTVTFGYANYKCLVSIDNNITLRITNAQGYYLIDFKAPNFYIPVSPLSSS
jgi:hypothetical protein